MTLFVKNTDTAIIGIRAQQEVVWQVAGIADDGLPILGEVTSSDELPDMEIRNGSVMYVTAEGDTYPDHQIEERRADGSVMNVRRLSVPRPLTANIFTIWKRYAALGAIKSGFKDWVEDLTDAAYLAHHGLYLRERDWRINRASEGSWQIAEHYLHGIITEDAKNGPWAIVGDDKSELVGRAVAYIGSFYAMESN